MSYVGCSPPTLVLWTTFAGRAKRRKHSFHAYVKVAKQREEHGIGFKDYIFVFPTL